MANAASIGKQVASWSGFIGSFLVFICGMFHVIDSGAELKWPKDKFNDDINAALWRSKLFTFVPDKFADQITHELNYNETDHTQIVFLADIWTPVIMGLVGTLLHFEVFENPAISGSYMPFFLFHLTEGLFGCIGYAGGLGIIMSVPVWLCCLLALIMFLWEDGDAGLKLKFPLCSR